MANRPRFQAVALAVVAILAGMLAVGSFLDAVSNAFSLVTVPVALAGTVVIATAAGTVEVICRRRGMPWRVRGTTVTIRRLGSKWWLSLGGAVLLLWVPTLVSSVVPVKPVLLAAESSDPQGRAAVSRLEMLRDFVPRISDKALRFSERSIALAECVSAGVFRDAAAFEKTAELMAYAPGDPDERRLAFPPLVEALAPAAGANLYFIATRFSWAMDFGPNDQSAEAYSNQAAAEFWWQVFQGAFHHAPDQMMAAIADLPTSEQHFRATHGLCANLPEPLRVRMRAHASPVVRGLVALHDASTSRDHSESRKEIRDLVRVESDRDLPFAAQLLRISMREGIVDPLLAKQSLSIVSADRSVVSHHTTLDPERPRGREDRVHAAADYVEWAVQFQLVAAALEPDLLAEAARYSGVLRNLTLRPTEYGNGDLYARTCVKALLQMNRAMHGVDTPLTERISPDAMSAIEELRSYGPELLDRVNMGFLTK